MTTGCLIEPAIGLDATKVVATKRNVRACPTNRASQLDDPCLRRLVYYRTAWQKQAETSIGLQGIFETGNELEPIIERILDEIGRAATPKWRIIARQSTVDDKFLQQHQISGHIDGVLQISDGNGEWNNAAVVDVKTCNPMIWQNLHDYESLAKYPWTRKWRGQLMLYALGMNLERCCLICVNKTNLYEIRDIWFDLDMEYAENLITSANAVNQHVEANTLPCKLNQPAECSRCSFSHICMPDLEGGAGVQLLDNSELEELLQRRDELDAGAKELKQIDKRLKEILVEGQLVICGDYVIDWKFVTKNMKAKEAHKQEYWQKKIICTKGGDESGGRS